MEHLQYNTIKINGFNYSLSTLDRLKEREGEDVLGFLKAWANEDALLTMYTSGSTGTPKEIRVSKAAMINSALKTLKFFNLKPGMSALLCLPANYVAGRMMLVRALVGNLDLIAVKPSSHPLADIDRVVDFAAFTPMQMLNELKLGSPALLHLRDVIIGGAKVDSELDRLLQKVEFKAYETYGMTETLSHIALRRINGKERTDGFVPLPDVRLSLDDRSCLCIDAKGICDQLLVTNDIAEIREDGSFLITGRADNIINSGGIKHSPEAIENKIVHLVDVPFAISHIPHSTLDRQIVLVCQGKPSDMATLPERIKKLVKRYEMPAAIYIVDSFPLTESGKIKRTQLASLIEGLKPKVTIK
ncbi:AMP-binding protein [Xiashengella succiniciproducens]|uniref:AMP-binding protein n=1 Tax=Xiashengella succiniciproducens TaxID=2949635 RepID=A0A9J6ZN15_9BACT|nr:AMP-binding protein [Alkaliflexus sp. Ai-910]URW78895.1 AMP-binding protein [Alkaliflexus sp. Ai-910]